MESANKALFMAAEVIVGVMIISIAVFLFQTFANYSASNNEKVEQAIVDTFNNNFFKYFGTYIGTDGKSRPTEVTIHEIVTLAKFANETNESFGLARQSVNNNTRYIEVKINVSSGYKQIQECSDSELIEYLEKYSLKEDENGKLTSVQYFECTNVETNILGYVNTISFKIYND